MRQTKTREDDDDAVSPVIGVILMVAITVILAAVIGTFVLGLGEDVQETAQAGVNFDYDGEDVTVNIIDPGNVDELRISGPEWNQDNHDDLEEGDGTTGWAISDDEDEDYVHIMGDAIDAGASFSYDATADDVEGEQLSLVGLVGDDENLLDTYDNPE